MHRASRSLPRRVAATLVVALVAAVASVSGGWMHAAAGASPDVTQVDLLSPAAGSEAFGDIVVVLSNGNYVVTDPLWDDGATTDVGAVYLFDGATNTLISTLHGTTMNDQVGSSGVVPLPDGDFVVVSPLWDDAAATDVGAVTWRDGDDGVSGPVTTTNSLHGTTADDSVGSNEVIALLDGNYVVTSSLWDDGATPNVGAVTWGDGDSGTTGPVTTTNSLHGTSANDFVGNRDVVALPNGRYVVVSPSWDDGATSGVGAVTFGSADGDATGPVTTTNSLHGSSAFDFVGTNGVVALSDGDYVVASSQWADGAATGAGAVTWADGDGSTTGPVTTTNSLHGTTADDNVGNNGVTALTDGDYVVASQVWDDGATTNAGAVTWGAGDGSTTGPVTTTNSLHGTTAFDSVGSDAVVALPDGDYVVASRSWDDGATANVGAVTWSGGDGSTTGPVTTTNSLHGTTVDDNVGRSGVVALPSGGYLVASPWWDDGATTNVGAVTFGLAGGSTTGPVTTTNSLHGTTVDDNVGSSRVVVLTDGDYVVASSQWTDGPTTNVGAVTWGDGDGGTTGPVTTANSLHGTTADDLVGNRDVVAMPDGHYVVVTTLWDNGATIDAGAVTFGLADGETSGPVTTANSVIGTPPGFVKSPGSQLTTDDAVAVPTFQNRVLLMGLDLPTVASVPAVTSVPPERFVDTRTTGATLDGLFQQDGIQAGGSEFTAQITGRGEVPAGAKAVVANVTAVGAQAGGFFTAHQCVATPPNASSLNYTAGVNIANEVIIPLSTTGEICVFTSASTHLLVDVVGFVDAASPTTPVTPARYLDTRPAGETFDDAEQGDGPIAPDGQVTVPIAGRGDVPATAGAVIVNVTAIGAETGGFVTGHPCSTTPPNAASLNYTAGTNRANELIMQVDANGDICLFTSARTHLAVDVVGYLPTGSALQNIAPARLLDTRPAGTTVDDLDEGTGQQAADTETRLQIAGRTGIPDDATAVVVYLTAVNPDGGGFATVHACRTQRPNASSLNFVTAVNGGNEIIAQLDDAGGVCIYTSARTHLTADVVAYITEP